MELEARSLLLLVGAVHGAVIAGALWRSRVNRQANRLLALLLLALGVALLPQILGFAGAYDRFPWLGYLPLESSLLLGPLVWLYVTRLLDGRITSAWKLHLVPWLIQLTYYSLQYPLDHATDGTWFQRFHQPYVLRFETFLSLAHGFAYVAAAHACYRRYREWLVQHVSYSESFRLSWLRNFLIGTGSAYLLWLGFEIVDELVASLSYRQYYPFYGAVALLVYYFGIEGHRHAGLDYPRAEPADDDSNPDSDPEESEPASPAPDAEPDWRALGERFEREIRSGQRFLDPGLTLPDLARELRTNAWTLSRALNLGLGTNFNDFVNGFRVAEIQRRMQEEDPNASRPLLELALECGFSSKTSFNRSFKKLAGETPTAYRRRTRAEQEDS